MHRTDSFLFKIFLLGKDTFYLRDCFKNAEIKEQRIRHRTPSTMSPSVQTEPGWGPQVEAEELGSRSCHSGKAESPGTWNISVPTVLSG